MKTKLQLIIFLLLFSSQFVGAQVASNQVDITNTNSTKEVRYYYFPNLQAYYDLKNEVYIYNLRGVWTASEVIDSNYRGYSQNNYFYVEVKDYFGEEPHTMINEHKIKYPANYSSKHLPKNVASAY